MTQSNTDQLSSLAVEFENYISYFEEHGIEPPPRYNNNRERIERIEAEARSLMIDFIEKITQLETLGYL